MSSNGDPAFPSGPASGNWGVAFLGMSLRDYFAARLVGRILREHRKGVWNPDEIAETAYRLADAMLKAREQ